MKPLTKPHGDEWDYDTDLIASMPVKVLARGDSHCDEDRCTHYLLHGAAGFGLLTSGRGCCSGCDPLAACDPAGDWWATQVRDVLWRSIEWKPDAATMLAYLADKDGDWAFETRRYDAAAIQRFTAGALTALRSLATAEGA